MTHITWTSIYLWSWWHFMYFNALCGGESEEMHYQHIILKMSNRLLWPEI